MLPVPIRTLGAGQRVLLVALLMPVVLIAAIAAIPALMILPFFSKGTERAVSLLTAYTTYVSTILSKSQPTPAKPQLPDQARPTRRPRGRGSAR